MKGKPLYWIAAGAIVLLTAALATGQRPDDSDSSNSHASRGELALPAVEHDRDALTEAIFNRRSGRSFTDQPLSQKHLAAVLWSTIGLTVDGVTGPTRAAPSAGATDPLQVYAVIRRADDLEPGVYRYIPEDHALQSVAAGTVSQELAAAALGQQSIAAAPLTVILAADYQRTTARYGQRGIQYVHFEAGHAAQNAVLIGTSLGLQSVIIGAFDDQRVTEILGLNAAEPLLLIPMGY